MQGQSRRWTGGWSEAKDSRLRKAAWPRSSCFRSIGGGEACCSPDRSSGPVREKCKGEIQRGRSGCFLGGEFSICEYPAFLRRPAKLLPHGQLVPFLDEFGDFAVFETKDGGGVPVGATVGRLDFAVRLAVVRTLSGIAQADSVVFGKQDVKIDDAEIVHLLHQLALLLGILLDGLNFRKGCGRDEAIAWRAKIAERIRTGALGIISCEHKFLDDCDVIQFLFRVAHGTPRSLWE